MTKKDSPITVEQLEAALDEAISSGMAFPEFALLEVPLVAAVLEARDPKSKFVATCVRDVAQVLFKQFEYASQNHSKNQKLIGEMPVAMHAVLAFVLGFARMFLLEHEKFEFETTIFASARDFERISKPVCDSVGGILHMMFEAMREEEKRLKEAGDTRAKTVIN